jgi:hypothetical protein
MVKSELTKSIIKMAIDEKILNQDDEFMIKSIDKYFTSSKISVALTASATLILGFIGKLKNKGV